MEMQVDVRRHHTAPEMTSELEYTIIATRQLRNESRQPDAKVRGPLGTEITLEQAMRRRAFDVWVHEQDLRTALGVPGNLDSPGAHIVRDKLLGGPAQGRGQGRGGAANSAVVFDIHMEFLRTVRVDADGRSWIDGTPSLGPAATLTLNWETYFRLACGRVTAEAVSDRIKTEGDPELTTAILRNFTVTP